MQPPTASSSSSSSAAAKEEEAESSGDEFDAFDEEVEQIQEDSIPRALRFNSPGRKASLSIFVEGKRTRKSPSRFVANN